MPYPDLPKLFQYRNWESWAQLTFWFFIGCWYAPRIMGTVGHSRAFAAFAAAGAIGLIAHMLIINPYHLGYYEDSVVCALQVVTL